MRDEGGRSREQHLHHVGLDLQPGHPGRYLVGEAGADARRCRVLILHAGQVVAPDQDDLVLECVSRHLAVDEVGERVVLVADLVGAGTAGEVDDRAAVLVDRQRLGPDRAEGRAVRAVGEAGSVRALQVERANRGKAERIDDRSCAAAIRMTARVDEHRHGADDAVGVGKQVHRAQGDVGKWLRARRVSVRVVGRIETAELSLRDLVRYPAHRDLAVLELERAARTVGEHHWNLGLGQGPGENRVFRHVTGIRETDVEADHRCAIRVERIERCAIEVPGDGEVLEHFQTLIVDADDHDIGVGRFEGEPVLRVQGQPDDAARRLVVASHLLGVEPVHRPAHAQAEQDRHDCPVCVPVAEHSAQGRRAGS